MKSSESGSQPTLTIYQAVTYENWAAEPDSVIPDCLFTTQVTQGTPFGLFLFSSANFHGETQTPKFGVRFGK